jgi:hypothetical protein
VPGKLLSKRRERIYELALKKIARTPDEIAVAVRREVFGLSKPGILQILRLPTSAREYENLVNFNGKTEALSEPERFAVLLHRVPACRDKAMAMIELHRFHIAKSVTTQGLAKSNDGLNRL